MISSQSQLQKDNETSSSSTELDKIKNELYKYLSTIESKINKRLSSIEEKQSDSLSQFQSQLDESNLKCSSLNDIVIQQKVKFEKIEELESFRRKAEDQLISHEIRLNNLRKEFDRAVTKYDRMYIDNLIVPGYVGDCAQFKNMRQYVDHNIGQVSNLYTAKEKMNIDIKDIKTRIEGIMRMFTSQVETYNKTHNDYINRKHNETTEYIAEQMKFINDEIIELRMSNCKYAIDLKNKASELNIEWEKMNNIRDDIYKTFNERLEEFKQTEKKTNLNVFNMSNEFKNVKVKFNELVQFIKDIRFKKNLEKYEGISKKDIKEVSKKIGFPKLRKAKSLDIGRGLDNKVNSSNSNTEDNANGNANTEMNTKEKDITIDYTYDYYSGENKTVSKHSITSKDNQSPQNTRSLVKEYSEIKRTQSLPKYNIENDIIAERNPEDEETKKNFLPITEQQEDTTFKANQTEEKDKETVKEKESNKESLFFKKHPNLLKSQNKSKNVKIVFTEVKEGIEKRIETNDNNTSEINGSITDKSFQSPNPSTKHSHKQLTALRPDSLKIVELSLDQQTIMPTHLLNFNNKESYSHLQLKPVESLRQRGSKKFKTVKESPQKMKIGFGTIAPPFVIKKTKTNGKDTIDCSLKQNQYPHLVLRNYSEV